MNKTGLIGNDDFGNNLEVFLNEKSQIGCAENKTYAQIAWDDYLFIDYFEKPSEKSEGTYLVSDGGVIDNYDGMKYDSIILNKCIEYIPNVINFLINILKYVKDDGRVFFINRDKRYSDSSHVWHIFAVRCKYRDELAKYLKDNGVETAIHYPKAIHMQEAYADLGLIEGTFPIAEEIAATELSLPIYYGITDDEVSYVIEKVNAFCVYK